MRGTCFRFGQWRTEHVCHELGSEFRDRGRTTAIGRKVGGSPFWTGREASLVGKEVNGRQLLNRCSEARESLRGLWAGSARYPLVRLQAFYSRR